MPVTIDATTNRLPCNASSRIGVLDDLSGEQVQIFKGVLCELKCALFNGPPSSITYVSDTSNITSVDLYVRSGGPNGTILIHKTLANADVVDSTYSAWANGTSQQFTFVLSDVDTNQTLPSDGTLQIYFNIIVTVNTIVEYVGAFGYGQIVDAGLTNLGPPVSTPFIGVYTDANGLIQNPVLNFTGVTVSGLDFSSALDPDLQSLAGASAVNAIYYRSAPGVWSPVSLGAGLNFMSGVLYATGGGGSGGDVFLDDENVFTRTNTIDTGSNGAIDFEGFVMRNDTPATILVQQQNAPSIVFESHCWADDGEGGGVDDEWEMSEFFLAQNTVAPTNSRLSWRWSHNGGDYAEKSYINSNGVIGAAGIVFGDGLAVYGGQLDPDDPQLTLMQITHGVVTMLSSSTTDSCLIIFNRAYSGMSSVATTTPIFFLTQNSGVSAYRFYGNALSSGNMVELMVPTSGFIGSYIKFGTSTDGATFTTTKFEVGPSGSITQTQLALGTTTLTGLMLINSTAAAFGAQQVSPSVRWSGQGWKSTATSASQTIDFRAYVLPVQGTSAASGEWRLDSSLAGGSFNNVFKVDSAGAITSVSLTTSGHNTFEGVTATGATGTGNMVFSQAAGFGGITTFTGTAEYPIAVANNTITASQGIASFLAPNLVNNSSIFFVLGRAVTATNCATFSFTPNATANSNRWSVGFFAVDNVFNVFQSGGASLGAPGTITDPGAGNLALSGYISLSGTAVKWLSGSGSPDGAVAAAVGSLYTRINGSTGTVLYVKETGTSTNLGWVAK